MLPVYRVCCGTLKSNQSKECECVMEFALGHFNVLVVFLDMMYVKIKIKTAVLNQNWISFCSFTFLEYFVLLFEELKLITIENNQLTLEILI